MRTTLNLDENMLQAIKKISGINSKIEIINRALAPIIASQNTQALRQQY